VVSRENADSTHETKTSIQPEESPLDGQLRSAALSHETKTSIQPEELPWWSVERMQL